MQVRMNCFKIRSDVKEKNGRIGIDVLFFVGRLASDRRNQTSHD